MRWLALLGRTTRALVPCRVCVVVQASISLDQDHCLASHVLQESTAMRRGYPARLEVVLRDRFLAEVRWYLHAISVLRACIAMRLALRNRLVRVAPARFPAVVRRHRSARPALLESTAIQVGFLRRPEPVLQARFLQPEL